MSEPASTGEGGSPASPSYAGDTADVQAAVEKLRRHAADAVASGSVPGHERDDITEELFSGLWEHWRAEMDAGATPEAAADRAVAAFGGQVQIGRDLAAVYHSRLYAATVGTLLPGVASATGQWPRGMGRTIWLLLISAALWALSAVVAFASLSPTRAVLVCALSVVTALIWAACARALVRGQRWALPVARLAVIVALVAAVQSLLTHFLTIDLIGAFALLALWPVFGTELSNWVRASEAIGHRLGLAVAVIPMLAIAAGTFPASIPELTATSPNDLHLEASVTCPATPTRPDQGTELNVVATFTWDRLDPWPRGIQPASSPQDWISAWIQGEPAVGAIGVETLRDGVRSFQPMWSSGGSVEDITEPDGNYLTQAGFDSVAGTFAAGSAAGPGLGTPIPLEELKAGHRYRVEWWATRQAPLVVSIDRIVVTYEHLGSFGSQAVATCLASGTGHPIDPPFGLP